MLLDAPAFKPVLTPEAALSIVTKSVHGSGWDKYTVADIRLVYTPYYVFSFDVLASEGQSPSGQTALNAHNGELNDFVPILFDRPLKQTKETEPKADVERASIAMSEAKDAAAAKLASHVGLKKDSVVVSAVRKIYVPSFRIWLDVAGDTRKFEVDALLGVPQGLEALPARPETFNDSLRNTLDKMKNPAGWVELIKSLFSPTATPYSRYMILGVIVLVLIVVIGSRQGLLVSGGGVECLLGDAYLGPKPLFGERAVVPALGANNTVFIQGTCFFQNQGKKPANMVVRLTVKSGPSILAAESVAVTQLPVSQSKTEKAFELRWDASEPRDVTFQYERLV